MSVASWASDVYDYGAFASDPSGIYGSFAGVQGVYGTVSQQQPMYQQPQAAPAPDIRGVGISFDQERDRNGLMRVFVRRIRPGSSAAECIPTINIGDTLVTVGGKNVYGLSLTTLRTIVPGPAGSTVNLGFQSEMGDRLEAPLKRTTARGQRAANPIFKDNGNVSETPSIALGDEAGSYIQRANKPGVQRGGPPVAAEEAAPPGWERKKDPKGFIFWVNHSEKKISYTNPAEAAAPAAPTYGQYEYGGSNYNEPEMPTTQV